MSSNTNHHQRLFPHTHTRRRRRRVPHTSTYRHSSQWFVLTWSFVLIVLFIATNIPSVHSNLLHPYDQAVGLWSLTLRRRDRVLLESMVFPPLQLTAGKEALDSVTSDTQHNDDNATPPQQQQQQQQQLNVPSRIKKRKTSQQKHLECQLRLNPDGTFILHPPPSLDLQTTDASTIQRLPLKGCWKMQQNPYCVTDRHYDELSLISYPKVRLHSSTHGQHITSQPKGIDKWVLGKDTITLEMRCKVWGRYGSNTVRRLLRYPLGRDSSRMTHGILSIAKMTTAEETPANKPLSTTIQPPPFNNNIVRRVICATFQAKSCCNTDNTQDVNTGDEDDDFWEYE